jgi:hypothetical protein
MEGKSRAFVFICECAGVVEGQELRSGDGQSVQLETVRVLSQEIHGVVGGRRRRETGHTVATGESVLLHHALDESAQPRHPLDRADNNGVFTARYEAADELVDTTVELRAPITDELEEPDVLSALNFLPADTFVRSSNRNLRNWTTSKWPFLSSTHSSEDRKWLQATNQRCSWPSRLHQAFRAKT